MYFKTYFSNKATEKDAVEEVYSQLKNDDIKLLIFFSSNIYEFKVISDIFQELSKGDFEVIGCTSSGEIALNSGITKGGISAIAMGDNSMEIKTVAIESIDKVPLFSRKTIIERLGELGYKESQENYKNLNGLLLIDGLSGAEEKVLSVVNSVFDGKLDLIGGSAGDYLKFEKTLISLNGKVLNKGAVFTLIKSNIDTKLYKENIFISQNIFMNITKANEKERKIIEIDNKPARLRYAELLGISPSQIENATLKNPIGRKIGDSIYISSIAGIEGDTLNMYAQVFENTKVEILKAQSALDIQKQTINQINSDFKEIYGIFCINCILRFLQFEAEGNLQELSKGLKSIGEYGGFVSYGEQFNKQHLNQTLTMLVFGRKK